MKPSLLQASVVGIVLLTLGATYYRVSTAPERRQVRLETARQTCAGQGGQWVREGRDSSCIKPGVAPQR